MTAKGELSPTMIDCLALAQANGGELIRHPGGFWGARNAEKDHRGISRPYHGTSSVRALVNRGKAEYSEYHTGRSRFPIAIKIIESRP